MFKKAKERYNNALQKQYAKWLGEDKGQTYKMVEILSWKQVEGFVNYAAERGWQVQKIHDGLRNGKGSDMGYRVVLEKKDVA